MNIEQLKEMAREEMLNTLKTNLDSAMIFTYIKTLEENRDKTLAKINLYRKVFDTDLFSDALETIELTLKGKNDGGDK